MLVAADDLGQRWIRWFFLVDFVHAFGATSIDVCEPLLSLASQSEWMGLPSRFSSS